MALNYIDLFDRAVATSRDRLALADEHDRFTFAQLQTFTHRLASTWRSEGARRSAPFAVLSPNTTLAMVALLGGLRAGGAWCNINLRNALLVNIDVLRRGKCEALFFDSSLAPVIEQVKAEVPTLRWLVCLDRDVGDIPSLTTFVEGASDAAINVRLEEHEVGMQGSTGGTTGKSKVVRHGPGFLAMNTLGFMTDLPTPEPPVNLALAPITHAGGIVALACLAMGGTVHLMPAPDLDKLLAAIEEHRVSLLFLPPTLIYVLLNHPRTRTTDFSSLRYLMAAAAPFNVEKMAQAHDVFGPVICQSFGQTESGFPLTFMPPSAVTLALLEPELAHRLKSVGFMSASIAGLEVMDDEGNLLAAGEVGELVVRGPTVMIEYADDPEATAAIKQDGWQRTGDLGYRDADGFVYVSDRKRDMIISGGFNVFPLQVEQALAGHPAVQDSAVIGVPDEKWGEAVKAIVELAPGSVATEDEIIAFCKASLGSVMAPKSVDFIAQLPRSAVGKVLKRELRETYWARSAKKI